MSSCTGTLLACTKHTNQAHDAAILKNKSQHPRVHARHLHIGAPKFSQSDSAPRTSTVTSNVPICMKYFPPAIIHLRVLSFRDVFKFSSVNTANTSFQSYCSVKFMKNAHVSFWNLRCNNSARPDQIIMVLWPFFIINTQCTLGLCKLIFDQVSSIFI